MVFMIAWEDEKLLKLKGTFAQAYNFSYHSHHDEGTVSYSLMWNARFKHINYDTLFILKKNGVSSFPSIPMNLKQCDEFILGKHSKNHYHDSASRACRRLELIHYDLCCPMLFSSVFGNK